MYPISLDNVPDGFELIDDKVPFDPNKHLQLEKPNEIYSLKDLGYSKEIIGVISRVVAIILVGLSVQYILDGIKTFLA